MLIADLLGPVLNAPSVLCEPDIEELFDLSLLGLLRSMYLLLEIQVELAEEELLHLLVEEGMPDLLSASAVKGPGAESLVLVEDSPAGDILLVAVLQALDLDELLEAIEGAVLFDLFELDDSLLLRAASALYH